MDLEQNIIKDKDIGRKSFWSSRWFNLLFYAFLIVLTVFIFKSLNNNLGSGAIKESPLLIVPKEELVYAPSFILKDVEGNEVGSGDFVDHNMLLVFWATWCSFCAKELPDLKNFTEEYKDKIKVVAIVSRESKGVVQEYIIQKEINFQILMDPNGSVWNDYYIRGTPAHFLIDKEGKIIASRPGYTSKRGLDVMATMVE